MEKSCRFSLDLMIQKFSNLATTYTHFKVVQMDITTGLMFPNMISTIAYNKTCLLDSLFVTILRGICSDWHYFVRKLNIQNKHKRRIKKSSDKIHSCIHGQVGNLPNLDWDAFHKEVLFINKVCDYELKNNAYHLQTSNHKITIGDVVIEYNQMP